MPGKELVLATTSKRRIELLEKLGVRFKVMNPMIAENIYDDPVKTVLENSYLKAYSVLPRVSRDAVVVGVDTVVYLPGHGVLGKPVSLRNARTILLKLRGKWHSVYSGVYIIEKDTLRYKYFVEETRVKMRDFSEDELSLYLSSMEPLDKAGGYAIQGLGALLIETIVGDYYNVLGLPLTKLYTVLKKYFGIDILNEALRGKIVRRTRTI